MKISKNRYLQGFGIVVVVLGAIRCFFPGVATDTVQADVDMAQAVADSIGVDSLGADHLALTENVSTGGVYLRDGEKPHRIYSVPHFGKAFPDMNDVQLKAATKWGVQPVRNRDEAEHRKAELVYVGSNPYFYVDRLRSSIPYLVPKAAVLLQDIGRTYFDSLQVKGIPLHKIIVTSVMRSKDDVSRLRSHNGNATQNSCHLYGTTFDICYNRYKTVERPGETRRKVQNDTLKWILSEVLDDIRKANKCYIKYEVHQGCFHITVN
uniref:Peptidase M15A C-terminal domain-containing protein n=1 Tax=Prevotella sp. GTC17254 TaxID=3236794 RepID=A0AB33IY84_9BACT